MTRHLIDELVFELDIDSGNRAMRDEDYLSRLLTATMLPVIEEVLDEFDDGETVLVLPLLELDLGAIGQADYEHTAPQRLRAALDDALHRARAEARPARAAETARRDEAAASIISREDAELEQLARFLDTGTLPWHADLTQPGLHEALLERLLARSGTVIWKQLARLLAEPRRARRLVAQFPQRQLAAIVRGIAGERAAQFEDVLARLADPGVDAPAWLRVLSRCTDEASPALSDIESMARFLESGVLHHAADEDQGVPGHEALFGRLLANGGPSLRALVTRALAHARSARRLVEQFPRRQLIALLRDVAGGDAPQFEVLLAEAYERPGHPADDMPVLTSVWLQVFAACTGNAQVGAEAQCAHIRTALAGWNCDKLARAFADPRSAQRFVEQCPKAQLFDTLRSLAGMRARPFETLLTEISQRPGGADIETVAWVQVLGACIDEGQAVDAEAHCARIRATLDPVASLPVEVVGVNGEPAADPTYSSQLQDFGQFLDTGLLPHADAAQQPAHEALLDDLIARADEALWQVLRRALAQTASASRLLAQFPERQLIALIRKSAPASAAPLERMRARISERQMRLWWHHALAACVARPAAQVLPARVCARVMLELGVVPEATAPVMYTRIDRAAAALPWRASDEERGAVRAMVRLTERAASAMASFEELIDITPVPELAAVEPASLVGLVMRQREQMARSLRTTCRVLEAGLLREAAQAATLRGMIASHIETNRAIAPQYRQLLLESIDAKATEAADPARFLGTVMTMLANGAPLDLDAVLEDEVAAAPISALATALKLGDAAAVTRHLHILLRSHGPQIVTSLRHFGRSETVRRALAEAMPNVILLDLAGLRDAGAPAILRVLLTPSVGLQAALGTGSAWNAWTVHCRHHALNRLIGAEAGIGRIEASGFLRTLAAGDAAKFAALLDALPPQFRAASGALPGAVGPDPSPALELSLVPPLSGGAMDPRLRGDDGNELAAAGSVDWAVKSKQSATQLPASAVPLPAVSSGAMGPRPRGDGGDELTAAGSVDFAADSEQSATQSPASALSVPPMRSGAMDLRLRGEDGDQLAAAASVDFAGQSNQSTAQSSATAIPLPPMRSGAMDLRLRGEDGDQLAAAASVDLAGESKQSATEPPASAVPSPIVSSGAMGPHLRGEDGDELTAAGSVDFAGEAKQSTNQPPASAVPMEARPRGGDGIGRMRSGSGAGASEDISTPADTTELVIIANAGMVLAGPYLPRLFGALGLTADGAFIDEQAATRAVHLLQYMVTGETHTPEYQLVLNKILCGVPTATPVPAGIDITEKEQVTIEGMIQAMVANAKVLGSCSVAAMRQTFFARKADLQLIDEAWQMRVHPGTFDMLLDRLPWTYSIIKFGWMARPVHVEWRPT